MATEPFLINPLRAGRFKRKAVSSFRRLRRKSRKNNPLGEEVLILGMNPRRRKRAKRSDNVKRKRRARRHMRFDNPKRKTRRVRRARRARARHDNPRRARRARRMRYDNPRAKARRARGRRTRGASLTGGLVSQTMKALPHVGVGAASVITTSLVPKFTSKISASPMVSLGGQLVWVFGGGYAVNKFTKGKYGLAWMIGGGSAILAQLVQKYLLGGVMAGLGLDAYEPYMGEFGAANPYSLPAEYVSGMGAFEDEGAFDGFGDSDVSYESY